MALKILLSFSVVFAFSVLSTRGTVNQKNRGAYEIWSNLLMISGWGSFITAFFVIWG